MSLLTLLLIILVVCVLFGGFYGGPSYGPWGWSPVGLILLVILILFLTGHLGHWHL